MLPYSCVRLAGFGKINPQTGSISRSQIVSPRDDESKVQVIRQDPYVDEVGAYPFYLTV